MRLSGGAQNPVGLEEKGRSLSSSLEIQGEQIKASKTLPMNGQLPYSPLAAPSPPHNDRVRAGS